ncbi:hypothetical protein AMTRI_Chr04g181270 [Amborella trichopoda]
MAFLGERIWGKRDFMRCRMTVSSRPWIEDACLKINDCDALMGLPDNVVVPPASNSSVFLGHSGFYNRLSPSLSPRDSSLLSFSLYLKSLF